MNEQIRQQQPAQKKNNKAKGVIFLIAGLGITTGIIVLQLKVLKWLLKD